MIVGAIEELDVRLGTGKQRQNAVDCDTAAAREFGKRLEQSTCVDLQRNVEGAADIAHEFSLVSRKRSKYELEIIVGTVFERHKSAHLLCPVDDIAEAEVDIEAEREFEGFDTAVCKHIENVELFACKQCAKVEAEQLLIIAEYGVRLMDAVCVFDIGALCGVVFNIKFRKSVGRNNRLFFFVPLVSKCVRAVFASDIRLHLGSSGCIVVLEVVERAAAAVVVFVDFFRGVEDFVTVGNKRVTFALCICAVTVQAALFEHLVLGCSILDVVAAFLLDITLFGAVLDVVTFAVFDFGEHSVIEDVVLGTGRKSLFVKFLEFFFTAEINLHTLGLVFVVEEIESDAKVEETDVAAFVEERGSDGQVVRSKVNLSIENDVGKHFLNRRTCVGSDHVDDELEEARACLQCQRTGVEVEECVCTVGVTDVDRRRAFGIACRNGFCRTAAETAENGTDVEFIGKQIFDGVCGEIDLEFRAAAEQPCEVCIKCRVAVEVVHVVQTEYVRERTVSLFSAPCVDGKVHLLDVQRSNGVVGVIDGNVDFDFEQNFRRVIVRNVDLCFEVAEDCAEHVFYCRGIRSVTVIFTARLLDIVTVDKRVCVLVFSILERAILGFVGSPFGFGHVKRVFAEEDAASQSKADCVELVGVDVLDVFAAVDVFAFEAAAAAGVGVDGHELVAVADKGYVTPVVFCRAFDAVAAVSFDIFGFAYEFTVCGIEIKFLFECAVIDGVVVVDEIVGAGNEAFRIAARVVAFTFAYIFVLGTYDITAIDQIFLDLDVHLEAFVNDVCEHEVNFVICTAVGEVGHCFGVDERILAVFVLVEVTFGDFVVMTSVVEITCFGRAVSSVGRIGKLVGYLDVVAVVFTDFGVDILFAGRIGKLNAETDLVFPQPDVGFDYGFLVFGDVNCIYARSIFGKIDIRNFAGFFCNLFFKEYVSTVVVACRSYPIRSGCGGYGHIFAVDVEIKFNRQDIVIIFSVLLFVFCFLCFGHFGTQTIFAACSVKPVQSVFVCFDAETGIGVVELFGSRLTCRNKTIVVEVGIDGDIRHVVLCTEIDFFTREQQKELIDEVGVGEHLNIGGRYSHAVEERGDISRDFRTDKRQFEIEFRIDGRQTVFAVGSDRFTCCRAAFDLSHKVVDEILQFGELDLNTGLTEVAEVDKQTVVLFAFFTADAVNAENVVRRVVFGVISHDFDGRIDIVEHHFESECVALNDCDENLNEADKVEFVGNYEVGNVCAEFAHSVHELAEFEFECYDKVDVTQYVAAGIGFGVDDRFEFLTDVGEQVFEQRSEVDFAVVVKEQVERNGFTEFDRVYVVEVLVFLNLVRGQRIFVLRLEVNVDIVDAEIEVHFHIVRNRVRIGTFTVCVDNIAACKVGFSFAVDINEFLAVGSVGNDFDVVSCKRNIFTAQFVGSAHLAEFFAVHGEGTVRSLFEDVIFAARGYSAFDCADTLVGSFEVTVTLQCKVCTDVDAYAVAHIEFDFERTEQIVVNEVFQRVVAELDDLQQITHDRVADAEGQHSVADEKLCDFFFDGEVGNFACGSVFGCNRFGRGRNFDVVVNGTVENVTEQLVEIFGNCGERYRDLR